MYDKVLEGMGSYGESIRNACEVMGSFGKVLKCMRKYRKKCEGMGKYGNV